MSSIPKKAPTDDFMPDEPPNEPKTGAIVSRAMDELADQHSTPEGDPSVRRIRPVRGSLRGGEEILAREENPRGGDDLGESESLGDDRTSGEKKTADSESPKKSAA